MKIDSKIINDSIIFYGIDTQSTVCMEECAELIQAISKVIRYGLWDKEDYCANLTEEIADVLICIELLKSMYRISDENIQMWIDYKQGRSQSMIEKESD